MLGPFWCNDSATTLCTLDDWPFKHGGHLSVIRHKFFGPSTMTRCRPAASKSLRYVRRDGVGFRFASGAGSGLARSFPQVRAWGSFLRSQAAHKKLAPCARVPALVPAMNKPPDPNPVSYPAPSKAVTPHARFCRTGPVKVSVENRWNMSGKHLGGAKNKHGVVCIW